jgi:Fe-S cluster assembly ATPase SufC
VEEKTMPLLEVKNLHVEIDGKKILNGLDLTIEKGKVHAIMGPNGSGKSTLAYVLAGKTVVDRGRSAVRRRGSPCSRTSAPRAAS